MASPRALQVLEILGDNAFRIDTESFKRVLEKVGARRFALYSINGATRTGKSFALNYFLRYLVSLRDGEGPAENRDGGAGAALSEHFVWKSGKQRTTVGIDLWSEPFFVRDTAGREVAILLMDTQGLFDERTTARANAVIFSFSALCSSVSIFNLMKNMDEKVLQELQFFTGYAHMVSTTDQTHHNQSNAAYAGQPAPVDTDEDLDEDGPFQRMVFLIRDFGFPDYDFGYHDAMGSPPNSELANYFTDTFHPTEDCPRENLFVREKILQAYKNVAFYLMPHPGPKFERNSTLPTDPDFEQHMQAFVEMILSNENVITKKVRGQEMTGHSFQKYVDDLAALCDKAEIHFPAVQTVDQAQSLYRNSLAVNMAQNYFDKTVQEYMTKNADSGVDETELTAFLEDLRKEALKIFVGMKIPGRSNTQSEECMTQLVNYLDREFEGIQTINRMLREKSAANLDEKKQREEIQKIMDEMARVSATNEKVTHEIMNRILEAQSLLQNSAGQSDQVKLQLSEQIRKSQEEMSQFQKRRDDEAVSLKAQLDQVRMELSMVKNEKEQRIREEIKEVKRRKRHETALTTLNYVKEVAPVVLQLVKLVVDIKCKK